MLGSKGGGARGPGPRQSEALKQVTFEKSPMDWGGDGWRWGGQRASQGQSGKQENPGAQDLGKSRQETSPRKACSRTEVSASTQEVKTLLL